MTRTVVVGNGLGMAIDAEKFNLKNAIQRVWDRTSRLLNDSSKEEIQRLVGINTNTPRSIPASELQLATIHRFHRSTRDLHELQPTTTKWITNEALNLNAQINYFLAAVANEFYIPDDFSTPEFDNFISNLCTFIKNDNCVHVATLNYDNILYKKFISHNVFGRFTETKLVDGFLGKTSPTFSEGNLERKHGNSFGWYMHLHGTPMYVSRGSRDQVEKFHNNGVTGFLKSLEDFTMVPYFHLVLTAPQFKEDVISGSKVLMAYWRQLRIALSESEELVIFGYSGADRHLNAEVRQWALNKHHNQRPFSIIIVTYLDNADHPSWCKNLLPGSIVDIFKDSVKIVKLNNILEFDFNSLTQQSKIRKLG